MNSKQCLSRQEVPGQFIASTLRMVHCKVDCFKMNSLFITSPLWRSSPDLLIVGVQEKEAETGKPAKCPTTWPEYKYLSSRSRSCHRQRRNPRRSEVCSSQRLGSSHAQEVSPRCKKMIQSMFTFRDCLGLSALDVLLRLFLTFWKKTQGQNNSSRFFRQLKQNHSKTHVCANYRKKIIPHKVKKNPQILKYKTCSKYNFFYQPKLILGKSQGICRNSGNFFLNF